MKSKREDILERINKLRDEERVLREELNHIDNYDRQDEATKLLHKCFIVNDNDSNYIRCKYVFRINDTIPEYLSITYFLGCDTDFEIEYESCELYDFSDGLKDGYYKEITKEVFDIHFHEVNKLITNAVGMNSYSESRLKETEEDDFGFYLEEDEESTNNKEGYVIACWEKKPNEDAKLNGYLFSFSPNGSFVFTPHLHKAFVFEKKEDCIFKDGMSWELGRNGGTGYYTILEKNQDDSNNLN